MSNGVLGLGQGAASLSNDTLEKLKAVDKRATVDPLEKKLENFASEKEAISNITSKVDEFLAATKVFSLNQSSGANAFHQKSANVSGEGVVFDAEDLSSLKTGTLSVNVVQLAQKDVWQSKQFDGTTTKKDSIVNPGTIKINGEPIVTTGLTYEKLVAEINKIEGVQASLVEDSTGKFRLSIKSQETGESNKIKFDGSDSALLTHFGFDDASNNVLKARDMKLKADGVDYSSSSNIITIDGLKITATKENATSTISIEDDKGTLESQMKNFADKYNDLRAEIENEIYKNDSSIYDKATLRDMLSSIKNEFFGKGNGDKSIFDFGFSLNEKTGNIDFNKNEFAASTKNGIKDLEALFTGIADEGKKGIATLLDEKISVMGIKKGLIDYELSMLSREETIKKDKEAAEKSLDSKYSVLAQQFATYGVMINQMESSFAGLKMMIMQSMTSN